MFWILQSSFVRLMVELFRFMVFAVVMVFKLSIHLEGILCDDGEVGIVVAAFVFFWCVEGRMRELYSMHELSCVLMAVNLFRGLVERYPLLMLSGLLGDIVIVLEMRPMGHCYTVGCSDPRSNVILRLNVNVIFVLGRRMPGIKLQVLLFALHF